METAKKRFTLDLGPRPQRSIFFIRLLTRLIFCWFLQEKGLLPRDLFRRRVAERLLEDPSPTGGTYYKVFLQNLFFGTLNQEQDRRGWRKKYQGSRDGNRGVTNLWRYQDLLTSPDKLESLLRNHIPFINGGLFDCLDDTLKTPNVRLDDFSEEKDNGLCLPNELFFGEGREIDLSAVYEDARRKKEKVSGLIDILSRYKFTVEEKTPLEEEVALDPELLGEVFENLLAAYNPETGATVRKQTGSFYTPREIVNYMVDESLLASFKTKLEAPSPSSQNIEGRLRHLFAYNDQPHQFTTAEVNALIEAIDHIKILDPACGSGAFPMGILHRLVFMLGKLDPGNHRWRARQLAKAREIPDPTVRDRVLADIEQAFSGNELDYGRKLYLIENCIYGVDIQPIAVQIAKLRFFISLVVDQKMNAEAGNLGILSLPNLETRFVAANTLIGLERPVEQPIRDLVIEAKEDELRRVRERHFLARTPASKARYREQDATLRAEIAELLESGGWDAATARQLATWDPYDQNASADFFDAEWMFGESVGFDITIGNPPYVRADEQSEWNRYQRRAILASKQYETLWEKWDLYVPFIERSFKLLAPGGISTLIVSDAFCHSKYAQQSKNWFIRHARILCLDFCSNLQIFDAAVHNLIYFFQKADGAPHMPQRRVHRETFGNVSLLPSDEQAKLTHRAFFPEDTAAQTFAGKTLPLGTLCYISKGMVVHADERVAQGAFRMEDVVASYRDEKPARPDLPRREELEATSRRFTVKYLLGVMNSSPARDFLRAHRRSNIHLYPDDWKRLPIPDVPLEHQKPMVTLVDQILRAKRANPNADLTAFEADLDTRVAALYGLTSDASR